eukprot:CAMPEP_0114576120 /NCGR_PEP_ID=MMETSP0125-20121206/907_1 /TAXON_ID=485358 ORGANISM="Aristerostoma sp., Strain ATCC 50986" /NCGR_SAMPLE_ID=MMETSP0125 /ASSEMBLY_ACC=CAM_ASM_000245 /LENGTH=201 /DNA_ID=CAMNT_0001764367 /DNA_START=64 /DNA_END=669 /DNA_ORIENTATION=-
MTGDNTAETGMGDNLPFSMAFRLESVTSATFTDGSMTDFGSYDPELFSSAFYTPTVRITGSGEDYYSEVSFTNVEISNGRGYKSGGIWAVDKVIVTVSGCTFDGNYAVHGAAIYYQSTDSGSEFKLDDSNTFSNNEAKISGGAIQFSGRKVEVEDLDDITFEDNTAFYGNDWAAYGVTLVQISPDEDLTERYRNQGTRLLQ